jgi:hypothetical protein
VVKAEAAPDNPIVEVMKKISEEEGKTGHIVFKYMSRSLLLKGVGAGRVTPPPHKHLIFPS